MTQERQLIVQCTYVGREGPCQNQCYRGVCFRHQKKETLKLCVKCGKRGTSAAHGYCSGPGCRWRGQYASRLLLAERQSFDAYINSLADDA